jgi:hypothetical protein
VIILQIVGYVLLGAGVIIGAAFGFGYLFFKAVQHSPNCQCPVCQKKRLRKPHPWKAVEDGTVVPLPNKPRARGDWWVDEKGKVPADAGEWKSTLQLQRGMRVLGRQSGSIYRVDAVDVQPYGYLVRLTNQVSGKKSAIPVQSNEAQNPIWLVRPSRKGR